MRIPLLLAVVLLASSCGSSELATPTGVEPPIAVNNFSLDLDCADFEKTLGAVIPGLYLDPINDDCTLDRQTGFNGWSYSVGDETAIHGWCQGTSSTEKSRPAVESAPLERSSGQHFIEYGDDLGSTYVLCRAVSSLAVVGSISEQDLQSVLVESGRYWLDRMYLENAPIPES